MKLHSLIEELNSIYEFAEEKGIRTHVTTYDEYLEITLFVVEFSKYTSKHKDKVGFVFNEYTKWGVKDNMSVSINFNEVEIKIYLDN